ncbi:phage portal protein [Tardiphaga sp. vice352]|uniref:phage portal protein n=1 Tax=Tardiphaga sp. vice352 TaxID=2592816 RepID=UPI001164F406|nr:phage portal protein [Tardiphaga sp. vice352]QDM29969.1 phage portal protein [Tardiphaga sp. vice352]
MLKLNSRASATEMFSRLLNSIGLERKRGLSDYDGVAALFGAAPTSSGVAVSASAAMECVPFASGVRLISESLASLPVHVYQAVEGGGKERVADHPLHRLLDDAPSDLESSFAFKSEMQADCLYRNDAFAFINRVEGKVFELIRLPAASISVDTDGDTLEPRYTYTKPNGTQVRYPREQILHIRGLGRMSPVQMAREAIGLTLTLERHAARLFGSGARPSGVLKAKKQLSVPTIERLRASFEAQHQGVANSGKTIFLEKDMDFESTMLNSVDTQFLEMRKFQIEEIARALRIPPHMLYEMGRATWSNSEEMGADFIAYSLLSWIKRWEGEIRLKLLTPEERKTTTIEFNIDGFTRADLAARYNALTQACGGPWATVDEARAFDNRPPIAGGDKLRPAPGATSFEQDPATKNWRPVAA